MIADAVRFEPTFIGRQSMMEIPVTYMDTFTLDLSISSSDSTVFLVSPTSFQFNKNKKTTTLTITFEPQIPDSTVVSQLRFETFSDLFSPDSAMERVGLDSILMEGLGKSYYLDLEMVFIPGGSFMMGSGTAEDTANVYYQNPDELFARQVDLSDFFIGRYEVTNQQYYEFWVEQGDSTNRPEYSPVIGSWPEDALNKPNHPVVGLSWEDALAFCRWLSLRTSHHYTLPTEAQWEYAATGGEVRQYPWSEVETGAELAQDTVNGGEPQPV